MSRRMGVRAALQDELKEINKTLKNVATKRAAILNLLELYGVQGMGMESTVPEVDAVRAPRAKSGKTSQPGSLDMARVVIRNAGRPMKAGQIRQAIVETYGVEPAKTLEDMLWKRCRKEDSPFYKNEEEQIGLREMQAKVVTVGGLGNQSKVA